MGVYYFSLSQQQFVLQEKTTLDFILIETSVSTDYYPLPG
jgi:hypothetical protein